MPTEKPLSVLGTSASEELEDTFDRKDFGRTELAERFAESLTFDNPLFEEEEEEKEEEEVKTSVMDNVKMVAELSLYYTEMGPGEKRMFQLLKDIVASQTVDEVTARISKELKAMLAAQITSWQAVTATDEVSKLIKIGYSREEAELMVEKEEERNKEKRRGSNSYRGGFNRGRGSYSPRTTPTGTRSGQQQGQSGHKK